MKIAVAALLILVASFLSLVAQQQNAGNPHFEVGEDRLISSGPDLPLVEPYLAVNPKDPGFRRVSTSEWSLCLTAHSRFSELIIDRAYIS